MPSAAADNTKLWRILHAETSADSPVVFGMEAELSTAIVDTASCAGKNVSSADGMGASAAGACRLRAPRLPRRRRFVQRAGKL